MNVTLKQLRAFVVLSETGTFTAAARQLHVTPGALSLLVKDLEGIIGIRLFERTTRQTRLAPAGRDFLPPARRMLDELDRAIDGLRDFQASERGVLRVACSPTYGATLVPELVARYNEQRPGVLVHLVDAMTEHVSAKVASGDADLGIVPERSVPAGLQQTKLFRDPLRLVCPRDHVLAKRKAVTWGEVLKHPFVSLSPDYAATLRSDLAHYSESLTLQPVSYVAFLTTALALVKGGRGVTAQPMHAEPLVAAFDLVMRRLLEPTVERRICLVTPRGSEPSPASASFQAFLKSWFKLKV